MQKNTKKGEKSVPILRFSDNPKEYFFGQTKYISGSEFIDSGNKTPVGF